MILFIIIFRFIFLCNMLPIIDKGNKKPCRRAKLFFIQEITCTRREISSFFFGSGSSAIPPKGICATIL